jgi:hypothetical protein
MSRVLLLVPSVLTEGMELNSHLTLVSSSLMEDTEVYNSLDL